MARACRGCALGPAYPLLLARQAAACGSTLSRAGTLGRLRPRNETAIAMKHAASLELFAHWQDRRGARMAPERAEIDPGAIRKALGDAFLLGQDGESDPAFRLAGTRVCALFTRELKGEAFIALWQPEDRAAIGDLLPLWRKKWSAWSQAQALTRAKACMPIWNCCCSPCATAVAGKRA